MKNYVLFLRIFFFLKSLEDQTYSGSYNCAISFQVSGNNEFFLSSVLQEYAAAGTVNQNYANILLMLLRLRQACDHPLLVKGYNTDSVGKVSSEMARRLPSDLLINLLDVLETSAICRVCNVSFSAFILSVQCDVQSSFNAMNAYFCFNLVFLKCLFLDGSYVIY